jgi:DNA polymerase (family 10)
VGYSKKYFSNQQIADLLRSVAAALELSRGDNRFRIIAYRRAADSVEHSASDIKDLWDDGRLDKLPGIGEGIAAHLDELFRTGRVRHFRAVLKPFPPAVFELIKVPGLGPKTALRLCKALGLAKAQSALSSLIKAARKGRIARVEGFGSDSQAAILASLEQYSSRDRRLLMPVAKGAADDIISWMKKQASVVNIEALGSLRRWVATIGDIDIAVSTSDPVAVISHFCAYPKVSRVIESGDTKASITLLNGLQIDLMTALPASFGSLLQHFTGSKFHNIALRELAIKKGYSLSEYGIKTPDLTTFSSESDFYQFLGLDYIPPELRENMGEIESAQKHILPNLVDISDIKGDIQIHSSFDTQPSHDLGDSSLAQIADTAKRLGYEYIGLTEHNPAVSTHSVSAVKSILESKARMIADFNSRPGLPHVFNGLEIDIQADGTRAIPDEALELLDYACVSIHTSFNQSRSKMTNRIIAGLNHPRVKFLAHPTGRLLLQREGVEIDWDILFDFCVRENKWLEIDAWPNRLDLPDTLVRQAIDNKVKIVINSDSHHHSHLEFIKYGVFQARRGWAKSTDVINCSNINAMTRLLKGGE